MGNKDEAIFKCANDLSVKISKSNGEVVLDEECCTAVSIILKNTGDIATSFLGSHNPQLIKVLENTIKKYFKTIKKTLKEEYNSDKDEVSIVNEELPEDKKWNGQEVPNIDNTTTSKSVEATGKTTAQKLKPESSETARPKASKHKDNKKSIK